MERVRRALAALVRDRDGAAMVEFAICAPVLLFLLLGIIELGRFATFGIVVASAARAGVQYGAQSFVTAQDSSGMTSAALNDAQNIPQITAIASHSCTCADGSASTCLDTDCASSHRILHVTVTTTGSFYPLIGFPGLPVPFNISQTAIRQVAE